MPYSQDALDMFGRDEVRAAAAQAAERRAAGSLASSGDLSGDDEALASSTSADPTAAGAASPTGSKDDESSPIPSADKGKARELSPLACGVPEADEATRPAPAKKVVRTVDDLEHKSCWICMDDDLPGTRFVHPCNCTLVAHESCLLTWVASQQQSKGDREPVLCPQCKAEFLIDENLGVLLKLLNNGDRYVARASSLLLLSTLGSSILSTSALIGFSSLRLFFGPDVARITLTGSAYGQNGMGAWRWWAWVGLPLVPVGLIANSLTTSFLAEARVKVLESLLLLTPFFLLPRPTLHHPTTPRGPWLLSRGVVGDLWSVKLGVWPSGPGAIIVMLGVGEVAYLALKREVERFVLGSTLARRSLFSWLMPRRANPLPAEQRFLATPNADGGVRFRVFEPDQPVGEEGAEVETEDVALALARARNAGARVQVRVWEDEVDGTRRRRDVVEAPINRDVLDAADSDAGDDAPADDATPDGTDDGSEADTDDELAAIELAIAAGPPPEDGPVREGELPLEALFLSRLSLTRIAASALVMPALSALAGRGLLWLAQTYSPSLARFLGVGRRRSTFGASFMGAAWWGSAGLASATAFDELDPVWWRNAVGTAAIVIVRDACSLLHKYLKIQSRKSRRIVERGLEGLEWD